ncbi:MAG: hypothetical protein ACP5M9_03985 [Candidatus Micrarchaeia archaeon]
MVKSNAKKIQALRRSQEIDSLLKKSIMESEALQSSGDDRPEDESHINELLESNNNSKLKKSKTNKKPVKKNNLGKKKKR